MMYGMMGGMIWMSLVSVVMVLGYAYIVWVLANKEAGTMKTVGQVIAVIIALVALVMLFYGTVYGGGLCGGGEAGKMMKDNPQMQKQMMEMQKMMEKYNK